MSASSRAAAQPAQGAFARAMAAVTASIQGKDEVVELALVAAIAGGHLLLEDVPGVGKTSLAMALAAALGGSFRRIQFTSDLLPGDVTGVTVLDRGQGGDPFVFRPGPLFANVVLADEINRATPKTQSALLEAMNEHCVSVDGATHPLPRPFLVLATQNPHDYHGTFPLPDSQFDRFLLRLSMGYPDREAERRILRAGPRRGAPAATSGLAPGEVAALMEVVDPEVEDYLLDLVEHTRRDPRFVRGVSPRGAQALYRAVQALAVARGRAFAVPEDVRELAVPVLAHRVLARAEGGPEDGARVAVRELLWELPAPA
jgi:MoxR-like ATPase